MVSYDRRVRALAEHVLRDYTLTREQLDEEADRLARSIQVVIESELESLGLEKKR